MIALSGVFFQSISNSIADRLVNLFVPVKPIC